MSTIGLWVLFAVIALMYASVGHGGASGYLAVMALMGYSQEVMRPSALLMNLFVSAISFFQFARARHFRWGLFWPFAVASVPMAWLGAQIKIDPLLYKRVLAAALLFAVVRLFGFFGKGIGERHTLPVLAALAIGAVLGLASGIIGIGGGILLSPLLLVFNWADARETAAVSALFIFVNSAAGIIGAFGNGETMTPEIGGWVVAAVLGGLLGGFLGSHRVPEPRLRQALGVMLLLASFKLMLP
ncbi:MAG: sulfite exporter TauE/SafE family protein [Flavobacteriales bacterium]|nr:sulfite exporter TauE/SafE family protein [Flavobacteriales bacterium]MCB9193228.1 sulfite exporter TauE/SafE family protein [Flavobacteriales bacterium]